MFGGMSFILFLTIVGGVPALPCSISQSERMSPYFILAGDSTTATQSSNGGGWGDGFLNTTLFHGASGHNFGHNGATTVSFRAGGDWDKVLTTVHDLRCDYHPFVTIQFGHNDQKASANISLSQYTANLEQLVKDVVTAGATPILVTPLSRRTYDNSTGRPLIIESLTDQAAATITAAKKSGAHLIDLNRASTNYLNAIGPENAHTYNLNPTDNTHLNIQGSIVFGGMVAGLIQSAFPALHAQGYLRENRRLEQEIRRGIYYWP